MNIHHERHLFISYTDLLTLLPETVPRIILTFWKIAEAGSVHDLSA